MFWHGVNVQCFYFPIQTGIVDLSSLDAILISSYHCMMALPYLTEYTGFKGTVYMTEPTLHIGRYETGKHFIHILTFLLKHEFLYATNLVFLLKICYTIGLYYFIPSQLYRCFKRLANFVNLFFRQNYNTSHMFFMSYILHTSFHVRTHPSGNWKSIFSGRWKANEMAQYFIVSNSQWSSFFTFAYYTSGQQHLTKLDSSSSKHHWFDEHWYCFHRFCCKAKI